MEEFKGKQVTVGLGQMSMTAIVSEVSVLEVFRRCYRCNCGVTHVLRM